MDTRNEKSVLKVAKYPGLILLEFEFFKKVTKICMEKGNW